MAQQADQDAYGNYVASLPASVNAPGSGFGAFTEGAGAPQGTPYAYNVVYKDTQTGHVYKNVSNAWVLQTS